MNIEEKHDNVHVIQLDDRVKVIDVLLLSDVHWDNPKCDQKLLKRHLQQAKDRGAMIFLNGDTFCLMQGAYDPRKTKNSIRPEHNNDRYFDSIIDSAVEFFKPYADNMVLIGYGNHETSILKRQETDILQRFVYKLNAECGSNLHLGGYGGHIVIKFNWGTSRNSYKIKYYHGSGGGGPVTKGTIQNNRQQVYLQDVDMVWNGHVHEEYELVYVSEVLQPDYNVKLKDTIHVRTSTYKDEYGFGKGGWHVERGAPPKPIGGRWLRIEAKKTAKKAIYFYSYTYRTEPFK